MNVFRNERLAWGILVCVFLAVGMTPGVWAGESGNTGDRPADHARRPWLMISLTPHGASKGGSRAFSVIKRLSGNPNGLVLHFSEVTWELVAEKQPEFIILSPQGTPWCRYSGDRGIALQNFLWALPLMAEEMNIPILGICGGHQALALAFGGKVGPIRAGEDDCMPYSRDRQGGVIPLTLKEPDPIFSGLTGRLRIVESHYDEVKVLPRGFVLLASDTFSPIQIMRHASKPVYGVQGHPEYFSESRPDGGLLIRNFLKIAASHNQTMRKASFPLSPNLLSLRLSDGAPTFLSRAR
jgi:GMP synthase (glutamine-hydrolysing)